MAYSCQKLQKQRYTISSSKQKLFDIVQTSDTVYYGAKPSLRAVCIAILGG